MKWVFFVFLKLVFLKTRTLLINKLAKPKETIKIYNNWTKQQ